MDTVWTVAGELILDDSKYEKSLDKNEKNTKKSTGRMNKGFKLAGAGIKGMSTALIGATAALGGMILKANESASEINKFSQVTGTTTDEFQRWDAVMKEFDFSMEQASGDLAALGEKALDAANGAGEGAELFGMLGVEVTDLSGNLKSQGEIFNETIAALQDMENVTERNAIASALLSTTGEELVPILNMTNEELQAMKGNANVIDEEQLKKAEEFKKGYEEIQRTLSNVITTIGIQLMPILSALFDWTKANMPAIKAITAEVFKTIGLVVSELGVVFDQYIMPIIVEFYEFTKKNWPLIKDVGIAMFGALIEVATSLWSFISNGLIPVFKALYNFIEPAFPAIGATIKTAFDIVIGVVNTTIKVFETLFGWIGKAIEAFDKFFASAKKAGGTEVPGMRGGSGGGLSSSGRANGGPVRAGNAYRINERTPNSEIFVPEQDGMVLSSFGESKVENVTNDNRVTINVESVRNDDDIDRIAEAVDRALFNRSTVASRAVGV